jgi:hypothetical protein
MDGYLTINIICPCSIVCFSSGSLCTLLTTGQERTTNFVHMSLVWTRELNYRAFICKLIKRISKEKGENKFKIIICCI